MSNRRDFLKKGLLGGVGIAFFPSILKSSTIDNQSLLSNELRDQFLLTSEKTHFNRASLGPSPQPVVDSICESIRMLEEKGRDGRWYFDEVHEQLAQFIDTSADQLALTRNCTEGMNIAAQSIPLQEGDEVIITSHEHIGGSAPWIHLEKTIGIKVVIVDLDLSGEDNVRPFSEAITSKTKAISFSHVCCTTGLRLPAAEIADLCREQGIYSIVDGAQAIGSIPLSMNQIQADFYVGSGHKWLFGPKGTGFIYINKRIIEEINPVFAGAYTDSSFNGREKVLEYRQTANREEYGTRNASIVKGLGASIEFVNEIGMDKIQTHAILLIEKLRVEIQKMNGIVELSPSNPAFGSSIYTFKSKKIDNKELVDQLRKEGFVLRYIYENDLDAIRLSLAIYNSEEEVDQLIEGIKKYHHE